MNGKDYLYFVRGDHADLVCLQTKSITRIEQEQLECMINKGFMSSIRDFRGLWNWFYDKGGVTEADFIRMGR